MLCNYFCMFYLSSLSLTVSAIASLLQKSLGRWRYARSIRFSFWFLLLSLNNLLIPLPFPLLELIASCVSVQSPHPTPQQPICPLPPPFSPCTIPVHGTDRAISHRNSPWERKRRKIRKGDLPPSPKDRQEEQSCIEDLWKGTHSNTTCCPKDERVHRSSRSHTFIPSLSLRGISSSTNTVGKIIPFAEAPACFCKNSRAYPEKKLWLAAVLLNFSPNLIWAQCDEILAHRDISKIDNGAGKT